MGCSNQNRVCLSKPGYLPTKWPCRGTTDSYSQQHSWRYVDGVQTQQTCDQRSQESEAELAQVEFPWTGEATIISVAQHFVIWTIGHQGISLLFITYVPMLSIVIPCWLLVFPTSFLAGRLITRALGIASNNLYPPEFLQGPQEERSRGEGEFFEYQWML